MLAATSSLVIILFIVLGAFVFLNNPKRKTNVYLLVLSLCTSAWVLVNALSVDASNQAINDLATRLITPMSMLASWSVLLFISVFPYVEKRTRSYVKVLLLPVIVVLPLSFTDLNITIQSDGNMTEYLLGTLYYPSIIYIVIVTFVSACVLKIKVSKTKGLARLQSRLVSIGLVFSVFFSLLIGGVLPALGYEGIWDYSPLFSSIFIFFAVYSIVRHKLFDLRWYVTRSVSYLFSLASLAAIYVLIISFISSSVFDASYETEQIIVQAGLLIAVALTFPLVRSGYDFVTQHIFYRENYQQRGVLSQISKITSSEVDSYRLAKTTIRKLSDVLKAKEAVILLETSDKKMHKLASKGKLSVKGEFPNELLEMLQKNTIIKNELPYNSSVYEYLHGNKVEVIAQLCTGEGVVGYIIFGQKENGTIYFDRDRQLVAAAADMLAVALVNAQKYEELASFNAELALRVKKATKEIKESNKKLVKLDRAKDDFIAMASHQLRPQITAVSGFISMLQDGVEGKLPKNQLEVLGLANEGMVRMTELVTNMLDLSKIEDGGIELDLSKKSIVSIVSDEVNRQQAKADKKGIIITLDAPTTVPLVSIDKVKLREVVTNFINNAIEYSPENSEIQVNMFHQKDRIRVEVIDQGIGVTVTEQEKLFHKFYRAPSAKKLRPSGTGVGLYIAHQIIKAHKGEIFSTSVAKKGSTFGFEIPLD